MIRPPYKRGVNLIKRVDVPSFIKDWNSLNRKKQVAEMAIKYGLSRAQLYQIRDFLRLPWLTDWKNHPGRAALFRRIKKAYVHGKSTEQIGRWTRLNDETIRGFLKDMGVKLRPASITNILDYKTKSGIKPDVLNKEIKERYLYKRQSAKQIAKDLGVDAAVITKRIKAMGYPVYIRRKIPDIIDFQPNYNILGIVKGESEPFRFIHLPGMEYEFTKKEASRRGKPRKCNWCGTVYRPYIISGKRIQLYCKKNCSQLAKEYRKRLKGKVPEERISPARLKSLDSSLRKTWGSRYPKVRTKILSAKPITQRNI